MYRGISQRKDEIRSLPTNESGYRELRKLKEWEMKSRKRSRTNN